jgi:microcystin-dependent protein
MSSLFTQQKGVCMKKFIGVFVVSILALGIVGFNYKDKFQTMGLRFIVPSVNGKANVFDPEVGEIIYDSSVAKFYGLDQSSNWVDLSAAATAVNPPGVILPFGGTIPPNGFLMADGAAVSRATYSDLFTAIGTNFGPGDGSTTFNLPDMRGVFMRGVDGTATRDPNRTVRGSLNGGNTGNDVGSYQDDALQNHLHHYYGAVGSGVNLAPNAATGILGPRTLTASTSDQMTGRTSTETRPKNVYVNYIVKY